MNSKNSGLQFDFFIQSLIFSVILFSIFAEILGFRGFFILSLMTLPILGGWQLLSSIMTGIFRKSNFHLYYFLFAISYLVGLYGFSELISFLGGFWRETHFNILSILIPFLFALFYYYKTYKLIFEETN